MSNDQRSPAQQLRELADKYHELDMRRVNDALAISMLRRQVSALWEVAYEGLPRGDAFYLVVEERTGQTRAQAERHFLPDNTEGEHHAQP